MTDHRYRVVLCEPETGIVLNDDGSRRIDRTSPEHRFESLEDALTLANQLLANCPRPRVEVAIVGGPVGFRPLCFERDA